MKNNSSFKLFINGAEVGIVNSFKLNVEVMEMIELKKKIDEAKQKLGMTNAQLSRALGYSDKHITRALREGRSTSIQNKLVGEIQELIDGVVLDNSLDEAMVSKAYHEQEVDKLNSILKNSNEILGKTESAYFQIREENEQNKRNLNYKNDLIFKTNKELNFAKSNLKDKTAFSWFLVVAFFLMLVVVVFK